MDSHSVYKERQVFRVCNTKNLHLHASYLVERGNTVPFYTQLLLRSSIVQYLLLWIFSVVKYSDFGTYAARGCGALSQCFYEHFNYSFQLGISWKFNFLLCMFHELRCACDFYSAVSRAASYSTGSFIKRVPFSEVYFSNVKFVGLLVIYYYYYYYYILRLLVTFGI
jgi:hypothetical protein